MQMKLFAVSASIISVMIASLVMPNAQAASLLGLGADVGLYKMSTAKDQFAFIGVPKVSVSFFSHFDAELSLEFRQKDIHFTRDRNKRISDDLPLFLQLNYAILPEETLNPFIQAGINVHRLKMSFENTEGSDSASGIGYHAGLGLRYMLENAFLSVMVRYESLSGSKNFSIYDKVTDEVKEGDWDGKNWALIFGIRTMVL